MGLRSPPPRILFFYEKSIQKRIKEEVSSLISPRTENLSKSFEEWNNRSILGDNDTKLYIFTIYNIVSPPQSLRDLPPCLPRKFYASPGGSKGATPPSVGGQGTNRFLVNLWILSFHKKVSPGCRGGEQPCKRNRFNKSKLRTNNTLAFTSNVIL